MVVLAGRAVPFEILGSALDVTHVGEAGLVVEIVDADCDAVVEDSGTGPFCARVHRRRQRIRKLVVVGAAPALEELGCARDRLGVGKAGARVEGVLQGLASIPEPGSKGIDENQVVVAAGDARLKAAGQTLNRTRPRKLGPVPIVKRHVHAVVEHRQVRDRKIEHVVVGAGAVLEAGRQVCKSLGHDGLAEPGVGIEIVDRHVRTVADDGLSRFEEAELVVFARAAHFEGGRDVLDVFSIVEDAAFGAVDDDPVAVEKDRMSALVLRYREEEREEIAVLGGLDQREGEARDVGNGEGPQR